MVRKTRWRSTEPGQSARTHSGQSGAALVIVLGVLFLLTLVVAGVAGQVRMQLRAARLNVEIANAQSVLTSAFQHQATVLQNALDDAGPSYQSILNAADPPCNPVSQPWSGHLHYCVRRHTGKLGGADNSGELKVGPYTPRATLWQIPVEVRWKLQGSDKVNEAGGWIIVDESFSPPRVLYVIHDHRWCRVKPGWTKNQSNSLPICQAG